jgi:F-type H+-transporting ATPase subunit delta
MSNTASSDISLSYAKAIVGLTMDNNKPVERPNEAVDKELQSLYVEVNTLLEILFVEPAVEKFLISSLLTVESKQDLIKKLIKMDSISPRLEKFLMIIIQQGRTSFLQAILYDVIALINEVRNLIVVYVETSAPLTPREKVLLNLYFKNTLKAKEIKIVHTITPSLIGGFKIQVGTLQVDYSLRTRFNQLYTVLREDPAKIWQYDFAYNK